MTFLEPATLRGEHARLEPLSHDHTAGLTAAARDGDLWKLWYTAIPRAEDMTKEIDRRLGLQKAGTMLPWTVFDPEGGFVRSERAVFSALQQAQRHGASFLGQREVRALERDGDRWRVRTDQEEVLVRVITRDLGGQFADAPGQLLFGNEDVPDRCVGAHPRHVRYSRHRAP